MAIAILMFSLDGKKHETLIGAAPRLTSAVGSGLDEAQSMYGA